MVPPTNVELSPADTSPDAILGGDRTGKAATARELAAVAKVTQTVTMMMLMDADGPPVLWLDSCARRRGLSSSLCLR